MFYEMNSAENDYIACNPAQNLYPVAEMKFCAVKYRRM